MALKKIFALGIGHNTPVCIDLALACDYVIEGLYHFDDSRTGEQDHGFKILGSFDDLWKKESLEGMSFLLTMGDSQKRAELAHKIISMNGKVPTLIHPTAVISHFARISFVGVYIYPFSYVQADSVIEENTTLLSHVNISHNTKIGKNCFFAGGAILGAYAEVQDFTFVGQGALIVSSKVKNIGKNSIIGARSLVTHDVPSHVIVAGSPARIIRDNYPTLKKNKMKILVLAGGSDQIALIQELKKRGHETILVDYFQNPPAKNYASKHIVASTLDVDRVKSIAIEENVDLVCTACTDQALLTMAKVSEDLGLPCYISYKTALNVTNKSYMKNVMMQHDIPTAKFKILDKLDLSAVSDFSFPVVVKPVDCNSSKGVKRVDCIEEFPKYLKEAIEYSRTKTAIVEEFKTGDEISADFYIENGIAKYLSATNSFKIPNRNSFTILGSSYPVIDDIQKEKLIKIAGDIAMAFNLDNCPLLIQLIIKGNEMKVIEFSARMGGGSKYKLIEVLSGVDIMSKYVDRILGSYPVITPAKQVNFCKMIYSYCYPGILEHIEGLEELKQNKIIDEYFVYKTKGMEISKCETSGDRPLGYLVTATTKEELQHKIALADKSIQVLDICGNDIMIHNLV